MTHAPGTFCSMDERRTEPLSAFSYLPPLPEFEEDLDLSIDNYEEDWQREERELIERTGGRRWSGG